MPKPFFVTPSVVAEPLAMTPLMVFALVLLPARVSTVAPAAPPVIPPPMFNVPRPAPVPLRLLLAKVYVPLGP